MGNSQPRSSILGDEPQRRHSTFIHKPIIDEPQRRHSTFIHKPTIDEPQRIHSIKTASKRVPKGSSGLFMDKLTFGDEPQSRHSIKTASKRVPIGSSALMDEPTLGNKPQRRHSIKTGSKRVPIGSSAFIHEPTIDEPQVIHKSVSYYSQPKAVTDYRKNLSDLLSYGIIDGEYSTIFTQGSYRDNALRFYNEMILNQDKFIDWLTRENNVAEFLKNESHSENSLTRIYDSHDNILSYNASTWDSITLTECGKDIHMESVKTCKNYRNNAQIRRLIFKNIQLIQQFLFENGIGKSKWNFKRTVKRSLKVSRSRKGKRSLKVSRSGKGKRSLKVSRSRKGKRSNK